MKYQSRSVIPEVGLPADTNERVLLLEEILDIIPNCLIAINKSGQVVYINQPYCELLGSDREAIVGRHVTSVVSPETQLHLVARGAPPTRSQPLVVRGHRLIVNQVPIRYGDDVVGAVGIALFTEAEQVVALARRLFSIDIRSEYQSRRWRARYSIADIIGPSREILHLRDKVLRAARTGATVLIVGESGTGKELVAHAIHSASSRAGGPFVHINCSAIPQNLLETELFGYEGGAFTGARPKGHPGKFELANGGTIFLDEIGDMPMEMQSVFLRVLQEREIVRVGGIQPVPVDVRVICATHRNLNDQVAQDRFRLDLFYRLNVIQIAVPALRDRLSDIPCLVDHILANLRQQYDLGPVAITPEVLERLMAHDWPGNIRELQNVLEHAVHLLDGAHLTLEHLPVLRKGLRRSSSGNYSLNDTVATTERAALVEALAQAAGNKSKAAAILKIDRTSLYKKLRAYDLI